MSVAFTGKIGSFEILRPLGEGGMGTVFLAKDVKLERRVAVKLLSPRLAGDADARRRFLREARSMASVEHPNVARIYSCGVEREQAYIEMEYIEGESLAERLQRLKRMSASEVLAIALQVTRALESAAAKGIVHRDIKPSNVLITKANEVKVADFGLARVTASDGDPAITGTGVMLGTPSYISPEQARGERVDHRSDMYSLGVMMFEMLAGGKPFRGATPMAIVAKHLHEPMPLLEQAAPETPTALTRVVNRMTQKDPDSRFSSYQELRDQLEAIAANVLVPHTQARRSPVFADLPRRAGLFLGVGFLVATLALGLYLGRTPYSRHELGAPSAEMEKLTSRGTVYSPVLSPDERYLAYLSDQGGRTTLWLRDIPGQAEAPLVDPVEGHYALVNFFSRDGAHLYFSNVPAERDARRLYRVPIIGGQPRVVANGYAPMLSPDGESVLFWRATDRALVMTDGEQTQEIASDDAYSAAWSPEGDRVLVSRAKKLSLLDVSTKSTRDIPHELPETGDYWVVWRPDSEMVAVVVESADRGSIYTLDLVTGETRPLHVTLSMIESVEWLRDGGALLVNAAEQGQSHRRIWLVEYPTGRRRAITPEGGDYSNVHLSSGGGSIAARQTISRSEMLVSNADRTRFTRLKIGTDVIYSLCWTSDGKVVYSSNEAGTYDLYVSDASNDTATRLTFDSIGDEFDPTMTPDGRVVIFTRYQENQSSLWKIFLDGTGLERLTSPIDGYRWMRPQVSPNGEDVVFMEWTNGPVLSKVKIHGGASTPVAGWRDGEPRESREYAFGAGWAPDGAALAFFHFRFHDEWTPIQIALADSTGAIVRTFPYTEALVPHVRDQQQLEWSRDGETLFFQRDGNLWAQPLSGEPASQVTHFDEPIGDYEWTHDGRILACTRNTELNDAVIIKNFW